MQKKNTAPPEDYLFEYHQPDIKTNFYYNSSYSKNFFQSQLLLDQMKLASEVTYDSKLIFFVDVGGQFQPDLFSTRARVANAELWDSSHQLFRYFRVDTVKDLVLALRYIHWLVQKKQSVQSLILNNISSFFFSFRHMEKIRKRLLQRRSLSNLQEHTVIAEAFKQIELIRQLKIQVFEFTELHFYNPESLQLKEDQTQLSQFLFNLLFPKAP